jgi:GNAT superfamily N-acetyltransferase
MSAIRYALLDARDREGLADLLITIVAAGGSVSFMHPLAREDALRFWDQSLAQAAQGRRLIWGAFDGADLIGTVTLHLDCPPNQPHRGEIAKMMVSPSYRGRGIGADLLSRAEAAARAHHRTLLVLDTAVDEGAGDFYRKYDYQWAGTIPDFAYKPLGGLTGTDIFYKKL